MLKFENSLLQKASQYLEDFKFQQAKQLIEQFDMSESIENLSEPERNNYFLLKSTLFYNLGEYSHALAATEEILTNLEKSKPNVVIFDALLAKARVLLWLGKYNEFEQIIDSSKDMLGICKRTHLCDEKEFGNKKMKIASLLTDYYWTIGDFQQLYQHSLEFLELCKNYGNSHDVASALLNMGLYFGETGNLDKAIEQYEESLAINLKNPALKSDYGALAAYNNIGENYRLKGDLDLALSYYNQCLQLSQKLNDKSGICISYHNLGLVYSEKGQVEKSYKSLIKGLTITKEIGSKFEISRSLFDLIYHHISPLNLDTLQPFFDELTLLAKKEKNSRIKNRVRIVEALFLKYSGRSRNIHKAEDILYQLLDDETVENELLILITLNLFELLFEELEITNEEEILDEIGVLIKKLLNLADKGHSFLLFTEFYYFKAKFSLLQLKLSQARKEFTEAQKIAKKYSLSRLEFKISKEHDDLLKKYDIWQNLKANKSNITDRLKLLSLHDDLRILMKKEELKKNSIKPEEPIFLSIFSKSGMAIYTYFFKQEWKEKDLFSSFMTAFNSFSNEIFAKSIDRVKIGEHTIIISPLDNLLFCYVIKGQTFPALKRLNDLIKEVQKNDHLIHVINEAKDKNLILTNENSPYIKLLIERLF